jgi:hypothetical protein
VFVALPPVRARANLFFEQHFVSFADVQNAGKPPAFAGGFGSGAIPELEILYTTTDSVSRKLGRIHRETEN